MCRLLAVSLGVILSNRLAFAGDVAAVVAALPDEASECRYLTQLCQEARASDAADTAAEKAAVGAEKVLYFPGQAVIDPERVTKQRLATLSKSQETYRVARVRLIHARNDAIDAAKVVIAKHEQRPSCVQECADVLESRPPSPPR